MSPRVAGDKTPFSINAIIDLGVYGQDGYTIKGDLSKRDTIPYIPPSLNHTTINRLAQTVDDYEFVIHPGDLGYADDWILRPKNLFHGKDAFQAILETFYDQLAPIAGRKPYMASPGNHEAACQEVPHTTGLCPAGQKNFTDFMNRFGGSFMPTAFSSTSGDSAAKVSANKARQLANPPFWFSFEYGMAHVVMIDTAWKTACRIAASPPAMPSVQISTAMTAAAPTRSPTYTLNSSSVANTCGCRRTSAW